MHLEPRSRYRSIGKSVFGCYSVVECLVSVSVKKRVFSSIIALQCIVEVFNVRNYVYIKVCSVVLCLQDALDFFVKKLVGPVDVPRLLVNLNITEFNRCESDTTLLSFTQEFSE